MTNSVRRQSDSTATYMSLRSCPLNGSIRIDINRRTALLRLTTVAVVLLTVFASKRGVATDQTAPTLVQEQDLPVDANGNPDVRWNPAASEPEALPDSAQKEIEDLSSIRNDMGRSVATEQGPLIVPVIPDTRPAQPSDVLRSTVTDSDDD